MMPSHSYKAHFHSAVAAAVGTAVIHAIHLAITEWTNRTKRPGRPSANWPWRVTLTVFVILAFTLIIFCAVKESDVGVTILDAVSVAHVVVVEHYIVSVLTDAPIDSNPKRCYRLATALQIIFAGFGLWQLSQGFGLYYDAPLISRAMFASITTYLAFHMRQSKAHMYLMAAWSIYAIASTFTSLAILIVNVVFWTRGRDHLENHALAQCVLGWLDSIVMLLVPWVLKRIVGEAAMNHATTTTNGTLTRSSRIQRGSVASTVGDVSVISEPSSARISDGTLVDLEGGDVIVLFGKDQSTSDLKGTEDGAKKLGNSAADGNV